jgi:hypothetical protein
MKTNEKCGYVDPYVLDLGTSWRGMVSITILLIYPRDTLDRKMAH